MVDIGIFLSPTNISSVRISSAESLRDPKIIGIKIYLFENFSQKRLPKIQGRLF